MVPMKATIVQSGWTFGQRRRRLERALADGGATDIAVKADEGCPTWAEVWFVHPAGEGDARIAWAQLCDALGLPGGARERIEPAHGRGPLRLVR